MTKILKPLAILAILGFPIAVLGFRMGLITFPTSFDILTYTVFLSIAVFLVGMVVSFVKRRDADVAKSARTAAMLSLLPLIGLGTQMFTAKSVPEIHNISTDIANPPAFDKVIELRSDGNNPLAYDSEKIGPIQKAAYPNVKTLTTTLSADEAHAKAVSIVKSIGWELVNADAQRGIVEATETTALWGFKDDMVIRISTVDGSTAVDMRSVSRIGRSDLGANAKRIKKFMAKFGG